MACNHKCGCGKVFHTPRGLKNHITRAHAGHPDRSKRVSAVDLARVTAERDAAVASVAVLKANMGIIAMAHKDANDVMHSALAERDALQARLDDYDDDHRAVVVGQCAPDERHCSCVPHLRAEVEAMRGVVEALAGLLDAGRDIVIKEGGSRHTRWVEDAFDALDALRTRKVGG